MGKLLFDLMNAPTEPPAGAHQLIWELSIKLRDDHALTTEDHHCLTCLEPAPCPTALVALKGLLLAVGHAE
jgi:hypothetical protein